MTSLARFPSIKELLADIDLDYGLKGGLGDDGSLALTGIAAANAALTPQNILRATVSFEGAATGVFHQRTSIRGGSQGSARMAPAAPRHRPKPDWRKRVQQAHPPP